MNQQSTISPLRRQEPVQFGSRHGYRIEGDHASLNAELEIPAHFSGGEWALELWATEQPYSEGALTGMKVAEIALGLPPSIGSHTHHVDAWTAARLPLQGRAHAMVLALTRRGPDAQTSVHAFSNYPERQAFSAPRLEGTVGYRLTESDVVLQADSIVNPRPEGNLSGSLSLELWAFPAAGDSTEGHRLAAAAVDPVAGDFQLFPVERRVPFTPPPPGRYHLALLLSEWTLVHGFVARDRRDFAAAYEQPAPESPSTSPPASSTKGAPVRPVERLRLVPPAEPATAPPSTSPHLVSIQSASVDELAKLSGLNAKLAQEIVKNRPFASVDDLLRVRGIGPKTIARLKQLVTL